MRDERTEAIQDNTEATEENTTATVGNTKYDSNTMKVEIVRASTVIIACFATVFIATRNVTFAENQAGIILGGVVTGYFGLASQRR